MSLGSHFECQTRDWAKDRRFWPSQRYGDDIRPENIEIHDTDWHWTFVACEVADLCPHCASYIPHLDCIVIAVDGACKGNGTPKARAGAGVFFGKGSNHNKSFALTEGKATNQIAELTAGILGLEQAIEMQNKSVEEEKLRQVIIKADSEYVVKGMTEWVFKWEKNDYRTSKGTKVTNHVLFKKLEGLVKKLNELNVEVLFWHVPRDFNKEADELASMALQE